MTTGSAGPQLVRRLVDIPSRARYGGAAGSAGELWFVIDGTGHLDVDGHPVLPLTRDRAVWLPPGATYRLSADGRADLHLDAVALPGAAREPGGPERRAAPDAAPPGAGAPESPGRGSAGPESAEPVTADLGECEAEMTGDRRFRVLFGPGRGCAVATQFVGEIPPGRAPDHGHPYDELVLILEGGGPAPPVTLDSAGRRRARHVTRVTAFSLFAHGRSGRYYAGKA